MTAAKTTKVAETPKVDPLLVLVREAHDLYNQRAFGPLQQAEFFDKVAALYVVPEGDGQTSTTT